MECTLAYSSMNFKPCIKIFVHATRLNTSILLQIATVKQLAIKPHAFYQITKKNDEAVMKFSIFYKTVWRVVDRVMLSVNLDDQAVTCLQLFVNKSYKSINAYC